MLAHKSSTGTVAAVPATQNKMFSLAGSQQTWALIPKGHRLAVLPQLIDRTAESRPETSSSVTGENLETRNEGQAFS